MVGAREDPGRRRTGDPRTSVVHRRTGARGRSGHPSRRRRLRPGGGRLGRAGGALGPLRDDVVGCAGHRAGAAAPGGRRSAARSARSAARCREAPRAAASRHGHDRAFARDPRGADQLRPQARGHGVRAGSRPRTSAACAGDGERRCDQRCRRHVRGRRPAGRTTRLRQTRTASGGGQHPGDPAGSPCGVRLGPRHHRFHAGSDRDRDPAPGAIRGSGGAGAVRRRAEGLERHAAQAEPRRFGARERARARDPRATRRWRSRTCRSGTNATSRTRPPSA